MAQYKLQQSSCATHNFHVRVRTWLHNRRKFVPLIDNYFNHSLLHVMLSSLLSIIRTQCTINSFVFIYLKKFQYNTNITPWFAWTLVKIRERIKKKSTIPRINSFFSIFISSYCFRRNIIESKWKRVWLEGSETLEEETRCRRGASIMARLQVVYKQLETRRCRWWWKAGGWQKRD